MGYSGACVWTGPSKLTSLCIQSFGTMISSQGQHVDTITSLDVRTTPDAVPAKAQQGGHLDEQDRMLAAGRHGPETEKEDHKVER